MAKSPNPRQPVSRPTAPNAAKAETGTATAVTAGTSAAANRQPNRAQSKKIVNRRQTPWGLIVTVVVILALAVGVVGYALTRSSNTVTAGDPNKIAGIAHYPNLSRDHVTTVVSYPQSPPVGGNHSVIWADCTGTVYPNQIANENAVHDLEHGAVWITYKPGLDNAQLETLTKLVAGQQYTILTPYAGLKTNVSLQAWGYQLFVDSASDKRVKQFIADLRSSRTNAPEFNGICLNAAFKTTPSTPGKPTES